MQNIFPVTPKEKTAKISNNMKLVLQLPVLNIDIQFQVSSCRQLQLLDQQNAREA